MEADSKGATARQRGSAGAAGTRLMGLRLVCVPTEGHLPERAGLRVAISLCTLHHSLALQTFDNMIGAVYF